MFNPLQSRFSFIGIAVLTLALTGCGAVARIAPEARAQAPAQASSSSVSRFRFLRERLQLNVGASASSASSSFSLPMLGDMSSSSSSFAAYQPLPVAPVNTNAGTIDSAVWASVTDDLVISVTPDRLEVFPGEEVTYVIRVCNDGDTLLTNVPVTFAYSGHEMHVVFISDSGRHTAGQQQARYAAQRNALPPVSGQTAQIVGGVDSMGVRVDQDRIDWTIPSLAPGESKILTVVLRMDEGLRRGDVVRGDALTRMPNGSPVRALSQVKILETMPLTGAGFDDQGNPVEEGEAIEEPWLKTSAPSMQQAPSLETILMNGQLR